MAFQMGGRLEAATARDTAVLRETIRKTEEHVSVRENFRVTDPVKMQASLLAVKPTAVTLQSHISDEQHASTTAALDAVSNRKQSTLTPSERYELPESSNQEYGFCAKPLVPPSTLFETGRKTCAETRFADIYYHQTGGKTPFSRKDDGAAKKA